MGFHDLFHSKEKKKHINYSEEFASSKVCSNILSFFPPDLTNPIVVVCIGTDRCTGDSLGPLVGTKLEERGLQSIKIYGTLESPVHALNLEDTLTLIKSSYTNPFIIGVDACLGKQANVGNVEVGTGPVIPGAAMKKNLPHVGDMHITGIVNISGFMEFSILQNTRLYIVNKLATIIYEALLKVDRHVSFTNKEFNHNTISAKNNL